MMRAQYYIILSAVETVESETVEQRSLSAAAEVMRLMIMMMIRDYYQIQLEDYLHIIYLLVILYCLHVLIYLII